MFIRDQANVPPPARSVDKKGPTDRPVDGVAGGNAAEDTAPPARIVVDHLERKEVHDDSR